MLVFALWMAIAFMPIETKYIKRCQMLQSKRKVSRLSTRAFNQIAKYGIIFY